MPIIYNCEQYSDEWDRLHMGILTASGFSKLITAKGSPSEQWRKYACHLVAERLLGRPVDTYTSEYMMRGKELEEEAVDFYCMTRKVDVKTVGFITTDDGKIGCSPDRLVGEDGLVEIKVPAPQTHIYYALFDELEADYKAQVQGQLLITNRQWVDVISYHPEIYPAVIRVERDVEYIASLQAIANKVNHFIDEVMAKYVEKGVKPPARQLPDKAHYLTA